MQPDRAASNNASVGSQVTSTRTASFSETDAQRLGLDIRASSPAKRSVSEREKDDHSHADLDNSMDAQGQQRSPKKTYQEHLSPMPNRFKPVNDVSRMQRSVSVAVEEEGQISNQPEAQSVSGSDTSPPSARDTEMLNTSAMSSPPTSTDPETEPPGKIRGGAEDIPSIDEQVRIIRELHGNTEMRDGGKGYAISCKWLIRVQSRTTQGVNEGHDKSAREGEVGPVDNSDIVANDNFYGDLRDRLGERFVPLQPGLAYDTDYAILPSQAWGLVVQWCGVAEESHVAIRYMRNTAPAGATSQNLQWEAYPPVFTIQKLRNDEDGLSMAAMKEKDASAVSIVASRGDGFQDFLKRAKTAANIGMTTKVKIWKLLEIAQPTEARNGMPTPISSRSNSPAPQSSLARTTPKLVVDLNAFTSLIEGGQRELIDINDHTANEKYNGHFKLAEAGFSEEQTLILEEQLRTSSDEYVSDKLKRSAAQSGVDLSAEAAKQSPSKSKVVTSNAPAGTRRSPTPSGVMTRGQVNKRGKARGTTGLGNLGNTCYMNSALQCIRSVEELTLYFLEGRAKREINPDNPLGHKGAIAKAYEGFLSSVYDADSTSFSPRNFKNTVGREQPLFSGYGQQDSQEFLSFLVDGLHEDLNRVRKKPYRENPDSDDKTVHDPDAIKQLGETYRDNHRARNDSIAMDLFNGFYKNTMVCPICNKVSVTFDPYSLLTLQLPIESTFQHPFMFVPLEGRPIFVNVDMDKNSNVHMLKEYIAKRTPGTKAENLVVAEQYSRKFYKVFEDAEVLSEAAVQQNDKLFVYELDATPTNWPPLRKQKIKLKVSEVDSGPSEPRLSDKLAIPVLHRFHDKEGSTWVLQAGMILITREESTDQEMIFRKVLRSIDVLTTRDLTPDDDRPAYQAPTSESSEDAGFTKLEDTSDPSIQARSVEGEADMVDVTMTGTHDARDGNHGTPEGLRPSVNRKSVLLDPDFFVDSGLRNMFVLHYYSSRDDPIPCGFSTVNANDRFPTLESRIPRVPASRRTSNSSLNGRSHDRGSPVSSDDELSRENSVNDTLSTVIDTPPYDSDDNNTHYGSNRFPRLFRKKKNTSQVRRPQRRGSGVQSGVPPTTEPLIRLGEGIVVTWNREGFAQLFDGTEKDNMRGRYTIDAIETMDDPELDAKKARRAARRKQGVSLAECFEETSKSEVLSEENAWFCGRCKELRRATKTLEIWTVPDILVVHLKRFSSSSRLRDKVDVLVDFPTEGLDLSGKVGLPEDKPLLYDLFAVDNHYGGLGGGHYTAYAQNFFDKNWYEYNDSLVHPTQPQHVVTKAAYLLFYRRRQETPLGPPYLQQIVTNAYASSDATSSGEDQRRDGSSSPNGSSGSSLEVAAGASPPGGGQGLRLGSATGGRAGLESTARSALIRNNAQLQDDHDTLPPYTSGYDEGIGGMETDPDDPLPGLEDRQQYGQGDNDRFIGPLTAQQRYGGASSWSFANLPARAGSVAELEGDNTIVRDENGSDSSTLANSTMANGDDEDDRLLDFQQDFEQDEFVDAGSRFGHEVGDGADDYDMGVTHVEFKAHDEYEEVAEVRVDDDEGA